MKNQPKSRLSQIGNLFQGIDRFGSNVNLRENGKDKFTTYFGAILSLMILIVVINFATIKFDVLKTYADTSY